MPKGALPAQIGKLCPFGEILLVLLGDIAGERLRADPVAHGIVCEVGNGAFNLAEILKNRAGIAQKGLPGVGIEGVFGVGDSVGHRPAEPSAMGAPEIGLDGGARGLHRAPVLIKQT